MKALVIADDEKIIKKIDASLKNFGYDVITYRWLLKALDNIEEISPHLIVISTEDYPRHWKTLTQFSDMGLTPSPKVVLFAGEHFSEEERNKAKALAVVGIFKSKDSDIDDFKGFEEILEKITSKPSVVQSVVVEETPSENTTLTSNEPIMEDVIVENTNSDIDSKDEPEEKTESEEPKIMPCSFVFTNPITLALVSGSARNFNGSTLEFEPDIPEFVKYLSEGTLIKHATLKVSDSIEPIDAIKSVTANVVSNDSEKLVLKIIA